MQPRRVAQPNCRASKGPFHTLASADAAQCDTYLDNATPARCTMTQLNAVFAQRIAETDLRLDRKSEKLCVRFPEFVE